MQLSRRRVIVLSRVMLIFLTVSASACNSDDVATTEGPSTGSATSTTVTTFTTVPTTTVTDTATTVVATTSDFPVMYDPELCLGVECVEAGDCCGNLDPAVSGCPNGPYPNTWTCEMGICKNGGCTSDDHCIDQRSVCRVVEGVGHCVVPCTVDNNFDDCEFFLPGTHCIGLSATTNFCVEGLPP